MPISSFQKVIPLSSLGVIMAGTSFSYVVAETLKAISLLPKASSNDAHCGSGLNKRGVAIRMSWYTFFEQKISRGRASIQGRRVMK